MEEAERTWPVPPHMAQTWVVDFKNAGANALARHFKQPEMRDAADLDAGAIILQTILHPLFDRAVVAVFFHVDEIDDNQTGKIAQAKLTRNFIRCFKIRLQAPYLRWNVRVSSGRS